MIKNNYPGKFIVIEGLDGSGKSTQVGLLVNFLKKQGKDVLETKEPTKDSKAGRIIELALKKEIKMTPAKLQQFFWQDRKKHLKKSVIPAVKKGKFVVCSRYVFSSFAYGACEGLNLPDLIEMNKDCLLPDLTVIVDVLPENCIKRIKNRGESKKYFEKLRKLKKVNEFYNKFPAMFKNMKIVDGEKPIPEVFKEIKEAVEIIF